MSKNPSSSLAIAGDAEITAKSLLAQQIVVSGTVPPEHVKQRPGRGGKTFDYISGWWLKNLIREAKGAAWSWEIIPNAWQIMPDGSTIALGRYTEYIVMPDGTIFSHFVQDVGTHDGGSNDKMAQAHKIASAATRAFPRCIATMYGLGIELYVDDDGEMSPEKAVEVLISFGQKHAGMSGEEIKELIKERTLGEIATPRKVLDNFERCYQLVYYEVMHRLGKQVVDVKKLYENETAQSPDQVTPPIPPAPAQEVPPQVPPALSSAPVASPTPPPALPALPVPVPPAPEVPPQPVSDTELPVPEVPEPAAPTEAEKPAERILLPLDLCPGVWNDITFKLNECGLDLNAAIQSLKTHYEGEFKKEKVVEYWQFLANRYNETGKFD